MRRLPWSRILALALFAVAMGYMEAVIVVYIRHIGGMVPAPPEVDYQQLLTRLPGWLLRTEQSREAATIVMLICVALAAGRRRREQFCIFLLTFGLWDLFYYAGLKVLVNWPSSFTSMDVLFLIPQPWFAPVWLPVAISVGMIVLALALYPPVRRRTKH